MEIVDIANIYKQDDVICVFHIIYVYVWMIISSVLYGVESGYRVSAYVWSSEKNTIQNIQIFDNKYTYYNYTIVFKHIALQVCLT